MESTIQIETTQDLHALISQIDIKQFVDGQGNRKLKTKIFLGQEDRHEFQQTDTIGEPVTNLIYVQNRAINHLLEVAIQSIRQGDLVTVDGHHLELINDELDPADQVVV